MQLQRVISRLGLLFVSVGAMIGSGWLFGPLYAAQIAGPAAILSWILGGFLVILVALTFAELSAMLPVTGGIARFPQFSHGALVSFVMTWIAWVAYLLLPPIEVISLLQYASNYIPWLVHKVNDKPTLTASGYGCAAILMFAMCLLNIYGIKLVSRFNIALVWAKIFVPTLTAITLIVVGFHASNLTAHGGFAPHGLKGIVTALPLAGVIFSFFGFRLSIELAGEAKNPQRALPIALIGSLLICMLIYSLVQFAFIGAVNPADLAQGWAKLNYVGDAGPFVGIASALGLIWLIVILYTDAVISPFGSALMVVTTTARLDYAMSVNRYVPKFLMRLNRKGVPYLAVIVNFLFGMLLLLPFPGWQKLATFIISALVVSHAVAPIALMALRKQIPQQKRPFKLPMAWFFSFLAFYILNLISYWTGWDILWKMFVAAAVGLVFLTLFRYFQGKEKSPLHWANAQWLLPYFLGLGTISYLGSFGGGLDIIPFGWDFLVIAIFSLLIFIMGVQQRLTPEQAVQQIETESQIFNIEEALEMSP